MKKIILIFSFCFLFSCQKDNTENHASAEKILEIVNSARGSGYTCSGKKMPLAQNLRWDAELASLAQEHSVYMDKKKALNHDNFSERMKQYSKSYNFSAENVAWGSKDEQGALNQWFNSKNGHCENLLNPRVTHIGVGRSGDYWTMIMVERR